MGPGVRDSGCLTYEGHFGLREKPFSLSPNPRFFYRCRSRRSAVETLTSGIRRREGILTLTGEVGTGKTTVCRAVVESLDRKTFAAFVPDPFVSREDLLKILLVDFGVVSAEELKSDRLRGASRTELSYTLCEFLTSLEPLHAFAVVFIDEAQNLPVALLEEIRILADLEHEDKLLQLVLVGQPELETRLAAPELRQLTQRLAVRVELGPLGRDDVKPYIKHRLSVAGNGRVNFEDEAIDRIWEGSKGIPRVINLLCDNALARAAAEEADEVDAGHIAGAAADLKIALPKESAAQSSSNRTQPESTRRRANAPRQGLPQSYSMRHDAHYVEELESRVQVETTAPVTPAVRARTSRASFAVAGAGAIVMLISAWTYFAFVAQSSASIASEKSVLPPVAQNNVVATAVSTPEPPRPAESVASAREGFAIQVATFQSASRAAESVRELEAAGYDAFDVEVTLRSGDRARAVFLGPYSDRPSAAREYERAQQLPGYTTGRIVEVPTAHSR